MLRSRIRCCVSSVLGQNHKRVTISDPITVPTKIFGLVCMIWDAIHTGEPPGFENAPSNLSQLTWPNPLSELSVHRS